VFIMYRQRQAPLSVDFIKPPDDNGLRLDLDPERGFVADRAPDSSLRRRMRFVALVKTSLDD
jgi:hypothetical protein